MLHGGARKSLEKVGGTYSASRRYSSLVLCAIVGCCGIINIGAWIREDDRVSVVPGVSQSTTD